jgi:hypothetical protein
MIIRVADVERKEIQNKRKRFFIFFVCCGGAYV